MRSRWSIVALLLLGACAFEPKGAPEEDPGEDDDPVEVDAAIPVTPDPPPPPPLTVVCRAEGLQIGVVGLRVEVDGEILTFLSWTRHADDVTKYVGFTLSSNATGLRYEVRTARDSYTTEGLTFQLPPNEPGAGGGGAIVSVDFCFGDD